jgi:biopolymer transport protein ExbB
MNTQRASRRMAWFFLILMVWSVPATIVVTQQQAVAADDEGGGEKKEAPKQTKSFFVWVMEASGFIGFVILLLSIYFVATVSRMFYELRLPIAIPPEILGRGQDLLNQRDFKGVFGVFKEDDSLISRLLSTGITELPNGLAEARDVMERLGESIRVEMDKKISILAVLGTLGPMIGLLGTLKGMIASFSVIAMSDVTLKASEVAGGISEALILTFEGVALSVPSIYFFSLFKNRVMTITTAAGLEADQFLRHFAHAARSKAPAGAPAAAAGAAPAAKVAQRAE